MSDITLRLVKGSPLTNQEVDDNFANLNTDKYQAGDSASFQDVTLDNMTGPITWNTDDGALDIPLNAQVTLQAGQEFVFYAKATEAIANGDVVMFAGAQGGHLLIAKCNMGAVGFDPSHIVGIATQSFANNEFGYVTSKGKVRSLDTSGFTEGDILYVDPTTAGGFTATKPAPPNHIVQVAAVTRSHATQGTVLTRVSHMPDTDEVPEGSTNLYFTDARAVSAIKADGDWNASNWDTAYGWGDHSTQNYAATTGDTFTGVVTLPQLRFDNLEKTNLSGTYGTVAFDLNDGDAPTDLGTYGSSYPLGLYVRDADGVISTIYHTGHFTGTHISNWNTAYGWGDHSTQGYLTSFDITTQTDPKYLRSDTNDTYTGLLSLGSSGSRIDGSDTYPLVQVNASRAYFGSTSRSKSVLASSDKIFHVRAGTEYEIFTTHNFTDNSTNWNTAYGWGDHSTQNYATQTYVNNAVSNLVDSSPSTLDTLNELAAALGDDPNFATTVSNSIGTKWTQNNTKISNWDTAYGWGNHASAGYLTSYSETDTLQSVTARGNTTGRDIIISKTSPMLRLYDSNTSTGNYPRIDFDTANNQGISIEFNEFDGELPTSGYGLVMGPSTTNTQFPTTGTLSLSVLGEIYAGGTTLTSLNKVFHDEYHPNADKWTTPRSHTVTLTGQVTGSATQSVDGTGNRTWSIATTLNDSALDDQYVTVGSRYSGNADSLIQNNKASVRIWDVSTATDDPSGAQDGLVYSAGWDSTSWGVQQYHDFHQNSLYLRSKQSGTMGSWSRVYTDDYHPISWNELSDKPSIDNSVDYINAASFNTSNGVLTLSGVGRAGATVDLDNRYKINNNTYRWSLDSVGNITDSRYYKLATVNIGNGGLRIEGTFSNHVESFGTQTVDLSIFGRELNSNIDIEIAGSIDVAASGTGTGIYVIKATDSSVYHTYDVYAVIPKYSQVELDLTKTGITSLHLPYSSSFVTTKPSGISVELDASLLSEGSYVVQDSEIYENYHTGNLNPVTGLTHDTVNTELDVTFADGTTQSLDLAQYLDDTNLSRVVSGSHVGSGIVRFVREDATTFDVDFSDFFDDTNLARITSASWNTSNGVLTLTRNDSSTVAVDLDGRYYNTGESDGRYVRKTGDTMTGNLTIEDSVLEVGNKSADNYVEISQFTGSSDFGFTFQHANASVFKNLQGGTNQILALGDVDPNVDSTLLGVSVLKDGTYHNRLDLRGNGSMYIGSGTDRVFADNYHPNADKWTTARTITLGGDLTGSVSIDGSSNVTLSAQVVNDSHTHDTRYVQQGGTSFSGEYGMVVRVSDRNFYSDGNIKFRGSDSRLTVDGIVNTPTYQVNGTTVISSNKNIEFVRGSSGTLASRTGFSDFIGYNPSYGSYIGGGVSNAGNYIYAGGYISKGGIHTLWHSGNDGSGSGLDADLLDGQHASAFASASHSHSNYLTTTGKAADSNLLDGIDSNRFVYGSNSNKTTNGDPSTLRPSGFYDSYSGNSPTSTYYSYINMRHTNEGNGHGHQIAGSFYSNGDLYNRHYDGNGSFDGWSKIWNTSNDGAGSGLDADLLDGQQGSYYAPASSIGNGTVTITTSGSASGGGTFTLNQSGNTTINISATDTNTTYNFSGSAFQSRNSGNVIAIDSATTNMTGYVNSSSAAGYADGGAWVAAYSSLWVAQIFQNFRNGEITTRGKNNGTWQSWRKQWDSSNDGSGSGLDADLLDGNHASAFLRSDADDTATGQYSFTKVNDHAIQVGTIRGTAVGGQSGQFIQLYERVNIGGPSGWGHASTTAAPTYGLSTYGGASLATHTGSVTISGNTAWHAGNDGSGSGLDADLLDGYHETSFWRNDQDRRIKTLRFTGEGGNSGNGNHSYAIYQEGGAWSHPYPDLVISYHTGIKIGAHKNYNGTRIYNDSPFNGTQIASFGDGDDNTRIYGNLILTGSPTTTNQGRLIDFTGFDKEGTTDFSDRAYIQHTTNTGGHTGSALVISSRNDSNDGIAFDTHSSSQLKHNGHTVWDAGNDGSGSGLDADLLDGVHASSFNRKDTNTQYLRPYYAYTNYLTTQSANTLSNQMGGDGGIRVDFINGQSFGTWGHCLTWSGYHAYNMYQLAGYYHVNGASDLWFRSEKDHTNDEWTAWNKIYHTGNDGSGSGLDADLLDGVEGSYFYSPSNVGPSNSVNNTGHGNGNFTWKQASGTFDAYSGWHSYLISNHGAGATYYNQIISLPFWGPPKYSRLENGTQRGPYTFWTTENDGSGSGLDADNLDGYTWGNVGTNIVANSHIYGRSVNGAYSNLYRFGGIYFTWDSDSYGTNTNHSIRSTDGDSYGDHITLNSYGNVRINFDSNSNGTNYFRIGHATTGTGNVLLTIDELGNATFAGNVTAYSDIRLKENIRPVDNSLDKVCALNGVYYNMKDDSEKKNRIGLIAQEVKEVLPEVVVSAKPEDDKDDILSVDYGNITALLIEAIKEQQTQISELQAQIKSLKEK